MPHNTTIQAYTALAVKFHLLPKHFNDDSSAPPSGQNPIAVKFKILFMFPIYIIGLWVKPRVKQLDLRAK